MVAEASPVFVFTFGAASYWGSYVGEWLSSEGLSLDGYRLIRLVKRWLLAPLGSLCQLSQCYDRAGPDSCSLPMRSRVGFLLQSTEFSKDLL